MHFSLQNTKPSYMERSELEGSEVYLQENVVFEQGKKYLIKAQSGKGKSSLLNFVYGLNTTFEGQIKYANSLSFSVSCQRRFSYVFQDFKLFEDLTVLENIVLKNQLTQHKTQEAIETMLQTVGLLAKKDTLLGKLSLGQRQRVAVIRALCQPFTFLLLDEPFSHLDAVNIKILTTLINQELAAQNAGLLLTSLGSEYLFDYDKILLL